MGDTSSDPIDHARTTRQHAGETMKNGANAPGLILIAVGVVALVLAMAAFAYGNSDTGVVSAAVAVVALASGGGWLYVAHRRVRQRELQWHDEHSPEPPQPPAS